MINLTRRYCTRTKCWNFIHYTRNCLWGKWPQTPYHGSPIWFCLIFLTIKYKILISKNGFWTSSASVVCLLVRLWFDKTKTFVLEVGPVERNYFAHMDENWLKHTGWSTFWNATICGKTSVIEFGWEHQNRYNLALYSK